jgi:hypothetical protein
VDVATWATSAVAATRVAKTASLARRRLVGLGFEVIGRLLRVGALQSTYAATPALAVKGA